jgi:hypothetical protein
VLGRKAPEKVKEVKIDFKKKIVYDPTKDPSEQESDSRPASAVVKEKTPEELEAAAAEAAENAVVAEAMQAVSASTMKRKKKRNKLTLVPLPLVPCVIFRGLSGKCKQNLAMMQSFATLFKMMSQNYGNREAAFRLGVAEEVSVIVTVCQGMPRVLDYYIWIIDALYRDGFGEINADELDVSVNSSCHFRIFAKDSNLDCLLFVLDCAGGLHDGALRQYRREEAQEGVRGRGQHLDVGLPVRDHVRDDRVHCGRGRPPQRGHARGQHRRDST